MQARTQQLTPTPVLHRGAAPARAPRAGAVLPWWAVALPVLTFLALLLTVLHRTP